MSKMTTNDGFSTGLKVWMLFLLTFFLLGYPVLLSIFWGALAGLAGGIIAAGLQAKEMGDRKAGEPVEGQESVSAKIIRERFSQFRLGVGGGTQNQDQRLSGARPGWFGRNRRPRPPRRR
jgi:hypothetical protein